MNTQELRERLREVQSGVGTIEIGSARKRAELEFHDTVRDQTLRERQDWQELQANKKYYSVTGSSIEYTNEWIKTNACGKVFLDYACGNGQYTLQAAAAGASLAIGLDLSPISIENARNEAARLGLSENTLFIQGDCENTGLPAECIDAVLCAGMLHHLDLSYAFPELRRIMKPRARLLAAEPTKYNPVIHLYRYLTPQLRTDWEKKHILSLADLRFAKRFFDMENVRFWHLASLGATPLRSTGLFRAALAVGEAVDEVLLSVPGVRLLAWKVTFELVKRVEE